jgi:hypothetical protein
MDNILCLAGPNPEVAEAVRTTVAARRPGLRLRRTLEGEIALYCVGMNGLRRSAPAEDETHRQLQHRYGPGSKAIPADTLQEYPPLGHPLTNHLLDAAQASYLRMSRTVIVASGQPYTACKPLLAHLRHVADADPRNPVQQLAATGPILGQLVTQASQVRAKEDVIIAGAALLACKGHRSAFPNHLEDASPTLPRDPFGTGPFRYRREGDGFVVYSVGPEGTFDGSQPGAPIDRHQAYFRYPATPQPPQRGSR